MPEFTILQDDCGGCPFRQPGNLLDAFVCKNCMKAKELNRKWALRFLRRQCENEN